MIVYRPVPHFSPSVNRTEQTRKFIFYNITTYQVGVCYSVAWLLQSTAIIGFMVYPCSAEIWTLWYMSEDFCSHCNGITNSECKVLNDYYYKGSGQSPIWNTILAFAWQDWGKLLIISLKIVSVHIWNEHLSNTNWKCYSFSQLTLGRNNNFYLLLDAHPLIFVVYIVTVSVALSISVEW
jgi:hypothetical protein